MGHMRECKVIRKEGEVIVLKVTPSDGVWRKIEKMKEVSRATHTMFCEIEEIINEQRDDGKEVMEVVDTVPVRSLTTGDGYYEVSVRLGDRGKHLKDEGVEYIVDWALGEFGKRVIGNPLKGGW